MLRAAGPRLALTHSLTHFPINTTLPSRSDQGAGHADPIPPMLTTTPWSHGLNALLAVALLAGLAACGPTPSDHGPTLDPRAAVGEPNRGREAGGAGPLVSRPSPRTSRPAAPLGVPAWMASAQESPDVQGRLRALETWAQQPRTGSVDPLLLAWTNRMSGCARRRSPYSMTTGRASWRQKSGTGEGDGKRHEARHVMSDTSRATQDEPWAKQQAVGAGSHTTKPRRAG